jgi:hypothetical protein
MIMLLQDANGCIFIPAGLDTNDLISASTGIKPLSTLSSLEYEANTTASESLSKSATQVELESEKDWLANLQSFVNQITASSLSTTTTATRRASTATTAINETDSMANADTAADPHLTLSTSQSDEALSNKGKLSVDTSSSADAPNRARTPTGPLSATSTRRTSTRTSLAGDKKDNKQDVDEFFRNLLVSGNTNAAASKTTKK